MLLSSKETMVQWTPRYYVVSIYSGSLGVAQRLELHPFLLLLYNETS